MKLLLVLLVLALSVNAASAGVLLELNGKVYHASTEDNITANEIFDRLPLELELRRYAEHEYFSELSFRPRQAEKQTSHLEAGGIYYWGGGNSFVINFEECSIAPYKSVYLGAVNEDEELCGLLGNSGEKVRVKLKGEN